MNLKDIFKDDSKVGLNWKPEEEDDTEEEQEEESEADAPEPAKEAEEPKEQEVMTTEANARVSNKVKRLESTHWHNDTASFAQRKKLRHMTGLQTWGSNKLDTLTKFEASELISADDDAAATKMLVEQYDAAPYKKNGKPEATAEAQATEPTEADKLRAQMAEMQKQLVAMESGKTDPTPEPVAEPTTNRKKKRANREKKAKKQSQQATVSEQTEQIQALKRQVRGFKAAATRKRNDETAAAEAALAEAEEAAA